MRRMLDIWAFLGVSRCSESNSLPQGDLEHRASCGGLWSVGRILYGYGYAKNGPDGRLIGSLISHLGDLPLQIAVFKLCYVAFTTW